MIKLIASDIDGTLLQNDVRELSPRIIEQIQTLSDKGVLFVAASGRQLANLERLFAPVKDKIAYIAENGALVVYRGKIILKKTIEHELGRRILLDIRQRDNCEILLSGRNTSYLEPKTQEYEERMRHFVKNNVTVVPDITRVQEPFLKISVYEKAGIEHSMEYFKRKWGNEVTVVTSGYLWLDMMAPDVNKGLAMKFLLKHLHISPDEAAAFGDNYNDIEMLDAVRYSYAMESARPGVDAHCYGVTDRVETVLEQWLITEGHKVWLD